MQIKKKPTAVQGLDVHQMRRACDALQYEPLTLLHGGRNLKMRDPRNTMARP
jgi:hypothetical protein